MWIVMKVQGVMIMIWKQKKNEDTIDDTTDDNELYETDNSETDSGYFHN